MSRVKDRITAVTGWFVDWDASIPLHYIWTDFDTRHCTYWMWRHRLSGWFVCPRKGHDFYPDHCGRRPHDICARCNARRDWLDGRPVACR